MFRWWVCSGFFSLWKTAVNHYRSFADNIVIKAVSVVFAHCDSGWKKMPGGPITKHLIGHQGEIFGVPFSWLGFWSVYWDFLNIFGGQKPDSESGEK